jgi:hypothetical protein
MNTPLCILGADKYRTKCQYCNIDRVKGTFTCSVDDKILARPSINIEGKEEIENYYLISNTSCNYKKFKKIKQLVEKKTLPSKG